MGYVSGTNYGSNVLRFMFLILFLMLFVFIIGKDAFVSGHPVSADV